MESTGCPICHSEDYIELDKDDWDDDVPVYRCEECGEEWT